MKVEWLGPFFFGLVVGWITYRILRYDKTPTISSLGSTVAAIAGAGAMSAFVKTPDAFAAYAIGLAVGFFAYAVIAIILLPTAPLFAPLESSGHAEGRTRTGRPTGT